ncbi:peptide ABC transporter substrate-binding protein [Occultella gossypii]|uniref:Peptide ABC transporter substrate-binding protein n=1 Tax=Occultella gossypii TaxID=2800820 RepID=A0ABS7SH74_9MICO|nr:peptide ABC transporter substrate-binding protein [Occultella gossypii]MBZ2199552.1 peptide ABC transporter substrate-binding protein [Occultella gossypii]
MNGGITVSRRLFLGGGIGVTGLTLAGCGFEGQDEPEPTGADGAEGPSGTMRLAISSGSIDSLDPHYVNNVMLVVPAGLLEGLVLSNDEGNDVVPAAAESWEVSEDASTYTFTMRAGATWSNGDPVTAGDAEWSFKRLLTPTGAGTNYAAGASSYLSGLGIKGATEHLSGADTDWANVGISASDDATLVVELEAPNSDFLLLMSHYSMVLLHPASLEAMPQDWMQPENWVGNGAYVPQTWSPTSSLKMVANESYWDFASVRVATIDMVLGMDATATLTSFNSGDLDIVSANATVVQQDPELQEKIVEVPGYGITYLQRMWGGHEAINDERVRRALSMAIDRDALAAVTGGSEGGTTLIPGNTVPGWDSGLAVAYDVDGALALLDEAGFGDGLPDARLQFTFESPWLEALAEQWHEALGITLHIELLEGGVHTETRWAPFEDTSLMSFYGGTFSGLTTMSNWVNNIFGPDYVRQFSLSTEDWLAHQVIQADESLDGAAKAAALEESLATNSDPRAQEFAELAVQARGTVDEAERTQTFLQAAALREEMAFTIPLMWNSRLFAVADDVEGFAPRAAPETCYYKYLSRSEG